MENYKRGKLLGKGSYGTAFLATSKEDGTPWVIKEISLLGLSKKETDSALQEAKLLLALDHPNIVACKEAFQEDNYLYIVLEFCSEGADTIFEVGRRRLDTDGLVATQGDLSAALKKQEHALPEDVILDWFVQLCLGLKHIHERKIVHRDLKPQNIFMSVGGILKIGDFGVSRILSTTAGFASTLLGTPYYLSPEICSNKSYNQKTDMWSLGCVLYEMTALRKPFVASTQSMLNVKIKAGQFPTLPLTYSQELRVLVSSMLQVNPARRPSAVQLLQNSTMKEKMQKFLSDTHRKGGSCCLLPKESPTGGVKEISKDSEKGAPAKPAPAKPALHQVDSDGTAVPIRGERLRLRAQAARVGQHEIANLRLKEQQKALEEEHRRIENSRKAVLESHRKHQEKEALELAAARLQAQKAAAQKVHDERAAQLSALKEKERQMLREQSRAAIKKQKAEWARQNKRAWSPAAAGAMEAEVLIPPPRPPLPSKQLLSSPRGEVESSQRHQPCLNQEELRCGNVRPGATDWPGPLDVHSDADNWIQPLQGPSRVQVGFAQDSQVRQLTRSQSNQEGNQEDAHPNLRRFTSQHSPRPKNDLSAQQLHALQFPEILPIFGQGIQRCGSGAGVGARDYALMSSDIASVTFASPATDAGTADLCALFGQGFSSSGMFKLSDGREVDMGVDWSEPLDVKARAIRRALKRRLGGARFTRCPPCSCNTCPPKPSLRTCLRAEHTSLFDPCRAYEELQALRDHSTGTSFIDAESKAVDKLAELLPASEVPYVALMEQLLLAEDLLQNSSNIA